MALSNEERWHKVHYKALIQFDRVQTALRDERLQCLQDRRFVGVAGAQWEGPLSEQFVNKPRLEVNKIHPNVIRIVNEYRNNRIDAQFISKDGEDRDEIADVSAMIYRSDEQDSNADEAYDNGFNEQVTGGIGAWRLDTKYVDEGDPDNDEQRIVWEPIFDADSCVFFDLNAKKQDKSDAKFAYLLIGMTREAYIEEYNDDPASWPKLVHQWEFDWCTPNMVFICEYYVIEQHTKVIHIYRGLTGEEVRYEEDDFDDEGELAAQLAATGFHEIREKKIKINRVHKYILNGNRVLEDCGLISGEHIPIVVVYGIRWFVDGVERCMGHVRLAKDVQRLINMLRSKLAEICALSTVQKPIFRPEEIAGHTLMWAEDNIQNFPYLLANGMLDASGNPLPINPPYTQPPQIPPAMTGLLQLVEQDIKDLLGSQQNGEEVQSNISGRAVELIQQRLDMNAYIYISNFSKGIKRTAEIWLSKAKEIYIEQARKMKGLNGKDKVESIELMRQTINEQGEQVYENDLSEAKLDVVVTVGPASASKRQATVRNLTSMLSITQDPETQKVLSSMIMMNMEGEGVDETRDYFRNQLVQMGVLKPTEEEMQQLQAQAANQQPDPNAQFLQASAEQAQAEAARARADVVLTIAKAKETEAKTVETLSKVDLSKDKHVLDTVDMLHQHTEDELNRNLKKKTEPATA